MKLTDHDARQHSWDRRRFLSVGALTFGALLLPIRTAGTIGNPAPVTRYRELWAMGGWNHIWIDAPASDVAEQACQRAIDAIRSVDRVFSVFDDRSEISRLNYSNQTNIAIDDASTLETIHAAISHARLTEGAFDPTVEPLMRSWGFRDHPASVLHRPATGARDWDFRMFDPDLANGRIRRESTSIQIDSGGWAKGLAAERAAAAAVAAGASLAQISCGGDIYRMCADCSSEWECGIRSPLGGRSDVAVKVRQGFRTAATSGGYESFRINGNGQRISHLMNPRTGEPSRSDLLSVTVFGRDGLAVDAVSSALFVLGCDGAKTWLSQHPEYAAVLIDERFHEDSSGFVLFGALERVS